MSHRFLVLILVVLLSGCDTSKTKNEDAQLSNRAILFVGSYTRTTAANDQKGEGVYVFEMNKETGALNFLSVSDRMINPTVLDVHKNGKWVYVVNEYDGGDDAFASITALEFDVASGQLNYVNETSSMGQNPCYLTIDNSGQFVLSANFDGASVVLYPISEDGEILPYTSYKKQKGSSGHPKQEASHPRQIIQHPRHHWVAALDFGADRVYEYELNTLSKTLNYIDDYPNSPRTSGPRRMAFHPTLNISYVLNELIGTVEVSPSDDSVRFRRSTQMISTQVEEDESDAESSDIEVHPNGRFLYVSNRGRLNEIVVFSIDDKGGISFTGRHSSKGISPIDMVIDATGNYLLVANQNSNSLVTFSIDRESGLLNETGYEVEVPNPASLKFLR